MKRLQIVLEVEIDEEELKEIDTIDGECPAFITKDEYVNGIIAKENHSDSGAILILNEDEEYYNENIGTCRVMKRPKIVNITEL